jgi:hypothetical protein
MTLDGLDTGEHWLSLPVNVLAGHTRSQTVVGFLEQIWDGVARQKQPLLCHAGACELSGLVLNHPRVITFRPWSIAGSPFETPCDPSDQCNNGPRIMCVYDVHLAKSRRAVAALLADTEV